MKEMKDLEQYSEFKQIKNYAIVKAANRHKAIILYLENYDYVATVAAPSASKLNIAIRAATNWYDRWMGNPIRYWGRVMVRYDENRLW